MTVEFSKWKETGGKVQFGLQDRHGKIEGVLYIDKNSELAKQEKIILEIAKVST